MSLTCEQRIAAHYKGRIRDLEHLWKAYQAGDEEVPDLGTLHEYGLCFDYVCSEGGNPGFFRYQLSTGGLGPMPSSRFRPGDEFRFYTDATGKPYRIEYWFLDWFDGASLQPVRQDRELLLEIFNWFDEGGAVAAALQKAL